MAAHTRIVGNKQALGLVGGKQRREKRAELGVESEGHPAAQDADQDALEDALKEVREKFAELSRRWGPDSGVVFRVVLTIERPAGG